MSAADDGHLARRFSALVGAAILIVVAIHPPHGWSHTICWCRAALDLPCPGCGLLRSMSSTMAGRFSDAWNYHPFGPLVLVTAGFMFARALVPEPTRRRLALVMRTSSRWWRAGYLAFVAAFVGFGIIRAGFSVL
jgi:hypothetical protein